MPENHEQGQPTVIEMDRIAARVAAAIEAVAPLIPFLETPHPQTQGWVRGLRTVPPEFLATMVDVVRKNPELITLKRFDPDDVQLTLQMLEAFRPVVRLTEALTSRLIFTLETRKAHASTDALQLYAVLQVLARDPQHAHLIHAVERLKRDLNRRKPRRRTKPEPEGEPQSSGEE